MLVPPPDPVRAPAVPTPSSAKRIDVLVSNCGSRHSYSILRALARHGLRVAIGQDRFSGVAAYSRYPAARVEHPPFHLDPQGFIDSLEAALERFRPAVYLSADEEIYLVAQNRSRLALLGAAIPIAGYETLYRLHDKVSSATLARSLGIPTPATVVPRTMQEVVTFAEAFETPIVVKLARRLKVESTLVTSGVFYLTRSDLPDALERIMDRHAFAFGDFLMQEYVDGRGYGVSMLCRGGEPRARFVHRRLRERKRSGGPSTLRESVVQPQLEEHAERLLRAVSFDGVAMVEFKVDEATGQAWFVEVNPRFWGSLALAIRAGVDFPWLLYRLGLEGDIEPQPGYRSGVRVRDLAADGAALFEEIVVHRRWPGIRDILVRADGYDDLFLDDLRPFLAEFILLARRRRRRRWMT